MNDRRPTFGSLFSGIGGIDLGLERAGWDVRWQVEWDEWCQRVLAKHWPDVPRYGDIAAVDWSGVESVDLLAGGFPCQPVSSAGRQLAQADERWLWPEFLRAIRSLRPSVVLVENVPNLLAVNGGSAFGDVLGDLAASGYDSEWDCIPAAAVGALHERDRVWLLAYPQGDGRPVGRSGDAGRNADAEGREPVRGEPGGNGAGRGTRPMADAAGSPATGPGPDQGQRPRAIGGRGVPEPALADAERFRFPRPRQLVEPLHSEALAAWKADQPEDGGWWSVEPPVGRVAHGLSAGLVGWRVAALKGLGNAVVPQVAEVIGRRLLSSLPQAIESQFGSHPSPAPLPQQETP